MESQSLVEQLFVVIMQRKQDALVNKDNSDLFKTVLHLFSQPFSYFCLFLFSFHA